jgi:hypothetical protein
MVDWKQSGFQIIASLIGSSLIVTALTSWISDASKPHVNMMVELQNNYVLSTCQHHKQFYRI